MKRTLYLLVIFFVLFRAYAEDPPIRIVTEEWAPYNYTQDKEVSGYSVEVIQHIMELLGKKYTIEVLPGVRSKYVVLEEPNVFMITMFRTSDRENQFNWIGPIADGSISFYKRSDNPIAINTLEDAKKVHSIACRYAGLIPGMLRSYGFKNLETSATNSEQIYSKLLLGRCDLAISDTDIGVKYILTKMGKPYSEVTKISVPVFEAKLYIVCNKDTPELIVQQWQNAIERLKQDKTLDSLYDKYF
jgi:polar amino acid transport system substrate-binding protein